MIQLFLYPQTTTTQTDVKRRNQKILAKNLNRQSLTTMHPFSLIQLVQYLMLKNLKHLVVTVAIAAVVVESFPNRLHRLFKLTLVRRQQQPTLTFIQHRHYLQIQSLSPFNQKFPYPQILMKINICHLETPHLT